MADIEDIIQRVIDDSWLKYDMRHKGFLNKHEAKQLLESSFGLLHDKLSQSFDLENVFAGFDKNEDGTISKDEMAELIMKVAGIRRSSY